MSGDAEVENMVASYLSDVRSQFEASTNSVEASSSSDTEQQEQEEEGYQSDEDPNSIKHEPLLEVKSEPEDSSDDERADDEQADDEQADDGSVHGVKQPEEDSAEPCDTDVPKPEDERKMDIKTKANQNRRMKSKRKHFMDLDDNDIRKPASATERNLMSLLFGGKSEMVTQLCSQADERDSRKRKPEHSKQEIEAESDEEEDKPEPMERSAAWHDSDDDNDDDVDDRKVKRNKYDRELGKLTYERRRKKFEQIVGNPKWADLDRVQEPDSDDEILQTVGHVVKAKKGSQELPKDSIELKVLKTLNRETKHEGKIHSICFHPSSMVAMIGGSSGKVSIVTVDGVRNEKLHTMGLEKFKLACARLTPDGNEAIFGGYRKFYHVYNLISGQSATLKIPFQETWSLHNFCLSPSGQYLASLGNSGEVHLLNAKTKELLQTVQLRYDSAALAFTPDSRHLLCHSQDTEVSVYSIDRQRIVNVFQDEGCVNGSSIAVCPNGQFVATGSRQGIVNIYSLETTFQQKSPVPLKTIGNLTTSIGSISFNATSELLAIASPDIKNAVRLVHIRSGTVFRNFPLQNSQLGNVTCVAFSPSGGYLAFGNKQSYVSLFRVKHYQNY
ncbi:U3 small nucleolar RNA-associated protein 18 homolog [Anopheles cruzii]|uniref:U3 small nucleolar RNA-associated protein 18 homolog n=1 Tax=Anopheles cruzii TaxID=68878 RepID=UPI0022EC8ADD|nr:U3 small nucleolar RNA-associated protein 18 homolog [Anopheles cruzii]